MVMLTTQLNVMNQAKYLKMSLTRRVINAENCLHRASLSQPQVHSQRAILFLPKLLSEYHWFRDGDEDAFKMKAIESISKN